MQADPARIDLGIVMPTLTNKTRRPLVVPLPGGKKLRLGPLKTAEVSPKALEHGPVKALIEAGEIEASAANTRSSGSGGGAGRIQPSDGPRSSGTIRHVGDR